MPHNRFVALQLAVAQVLIQIYYAKDPQKFVSIIKRAVLREAEQAFIPGDIASLHTLLRGTTFAKCLFQFGVFCYSQGDFLTFLKSGTADEFSFFKEEKEKAKTKFDEIIDGAYRLYAIKNVLGVTDDLAADMRADALKLFQDIVPDDALQGATEVSQETYTEEMLQQIQQDLTEIFAVIAPHNMQDINAGKRVVLIIGSEAYQLRLEEYKTREPKEDVIRLLEDDDNESHCCRSCCSMM